MTTVGYTVALMVFQIGSWLQTGAFSAGTGIAIGLLMMVLWLIFRPAPKAGSRLKSAKVGARG